MDRDTGDDFRESTMEQKAALACDSLDVIERATRDGCTASALQDIVGNLLVLLAWLDDDEGPRDFPSRATDARVRALVVDCLEKAGVPAEAIPDSLGLIRDCFGADGLIAQIDFAQPPPGTPTD